MSHGYSEPSPLNYIKPSLKVLQMKVGFVANVTAGAWKIASR